jgi:vitamin B12 transporter
MLRAVNRGLSLLCVVLGLPVSALSGQVDTSRAVKDSVARARRLLPAVIVSASREPMVQDRLGVSASVIGAAELRAEPPVSATDIVARFPGMYMDANAGPGGPTNTRLRGADDAFTKVLMDGVEVNVSGGPFRFQGMTASNLDRVELVRGPQSAVHGSNAMAGVVQFFTAAGQPGKARWAIETGGGSATEHGGNGNGTLSVSGGSDVFRYSAGGGVGYDEGIYDIHHETRTREASTRLDYDPAGPLTLTGTLRYNHMNSHLPVRNPGTTRVPLDPNQRDENDLIASSITAILAPSTALTHQLRLGVFHNLFSYNDEADQVPPHPTIPYSNATAFTQTELTRTTLSYNSTWRFAGSVGSSGSLTGGALAEREATGDTVGGAFGNGFTPQHRKHTSVFSELNASLGPSVSFLAGGSLDWYEGLGWAAVPRASIRVGVVPDRFSLRAAVGRGFKAPNIQQQFTSNAFIIPNPELKPETSWSAEVGANYNAGNTLQLSATYFQQWFYDLIRVVPAPAPETRLISKNIGKTNANGVEVEASGMLPRGVIASANLSWIKTWVVDNSGLAPAQFPVDSAIPSRPELIGGGTLDVPFGRLHAVARVNLIGRDIVLSEIFSGTRQTLDPYTLLGLTLTYDAGRGVTFFTRGDNLLNTYYSAGYDRRGIPRIWRVGLRLTN